jgi:predicted DNA-binding transcriptional regulator YafY
VSQETMQDLRQKPRDRLAYIEFRLWFLGDASRRDLMERFGIAPAVATRDFTAYRALAPQNIDFYGSRKVYVPSEQFSPVFEHAPERVLSALSRGFGDGMDQREGSYVPCEFPMRLNRPSLDELAVVTRAIHQRQVLRVKYHSLKRGAIEREVIPHALVDSGLRWHARAFDRKTGEFRDLVISRIETARTIVGEAIEPHETGDADTDWNRWIAFTLVVHPGVERPRIVERDFGMKRGELSLSVRAAVLGYVLQFWNVDCSPDRRLDPIVHRLCLRDPSVCEGVKSVEIAPGYGSRPQSVRDVIGNDRGITT